MASRTVVRLTQSRAGSLDPVSVSLTAIESAVSRGMAGTWGNTTARAALVHFRRPFEFNQIGIVVDTDRTLVRAQRRAFAEMVATAVNGAGSGVWTLPSLTTPIYYSQVIPGGANGDASPQRSQALPGGMMAPAGAQPPPPRWSAPPLFGLDNTIMGGTVKSSEPARTGITPKAADDSAPPESPHNEWTLDGFVPLFIVGGVLAGVTLIGGAIYAAVKR